MTQMTYEVLRLLTCTDMKCPVLLTYFEVLFDYI